MAYSQQTWADGAGGGTPIEAANLAHIENGIFVADGNATTALTNKGKPMALTGATAATRYVGGTASGAPVTGTFAVGDFVIDQSGKVWICVGSGSPGTWTRVGPPTPTHAFQNNGGPGWPNTAAVSMFAVTGIPVGVWAYTVTVDMTNNNFANNLVLVYADSPSNITIESGVVGLSETLTNNQVHTGTFLWIITSTGSGSFNMTAICDSGKTISVPSVRYLVTAIV